MSSEGEISERSRSPCRLLNVVERLHGPSLLGMAPPTLPPRPHPCSRPHRKSGSRGSSEGHELKLPFALPLGHPDGVGGMLRLHYAHRQSVVSRVDGVRHDLAGREGETGQGKLAQEPPLLQPITLKDPFDWRRVWGEWGQIQLVMGEGGGVDWLNGQKWILIG